VRPAAHETAGDVLQLRKLHFQLALVAAGSLGEDVEDQRIAVEHAQTDQLLEVAFLARRQRVIDEDDFGAVVPPQPGAPLRPYRCRRTGADPAAHDDR
jgi:hypothetical protein